MSEIYDGIKRCKALVDEMNKQLTPELMPHNFDVQKFMNDLKVNQVIAEARANKLQEVVDTHSGIIFNQTDQLEYDELEIELIEQDTEAKLYKQIIDSIEAGKYFIR